LCKIKNNWLHLCAQFSVARIEVVEGCEAEPPEVPPQSGIETRTERSWPSGSGQAEFAKSPTYWTKEALP